MNYIFFHYRKMGKNNKKLIQVLSIITAVGIGLAQVGPPPLVYASAARANVDTVLSGNPETESINTSQDESIKIESPALGSKTEMQETEGSQLESPKDNETETIPETERNVDESVKKNQPVSVKKKSDERECTKLEIKNPIYVNTTGNSGKTEGATVTWTVKDSSTLNGAVKDAGNGLKRSIVNHESGILISFGAYDIVSDLEISSEDYENYKDYLADGSVSENEEDAIKNLILAAMLIEAATEHPVQAREGDYLYHDFVSGAYSYHAEEGNYYLTFSDIHYLTSDSQQNAVKSKTEDIIKDADLDHESDYEKVKFIYSYLVNNISYDSNKLSAFDALEYGKANYSGFASLTYYMLNSLGIDARIVTGGDKEWVIVKLSGQYYNIDPAGDIIAGNKDSYHFFLKGTDPFFVSHTPDSRYASDSFNAAYPLSESDYEPLSITLDKTEIKLTVDDQVRLTAESSDGGKIIFSSSDETVASVSKDGLVTALNAGDAVITASCGSAQASCAVYVVNYHNVTVSSENTEYVSGTGKYLEKDVVSITAIRETRDGYRFVAWEIHPEVKILDGFDLATSRLSFYMPPDSDVTCNAKYVSIPVTGIALDKTELNMEIGDTETVTWAVTPSNAYEGTIKVESSDEEVAYVYKNGEVKAIGPGVATITFSSEETKAECKVTVKAEEYTIKVTARNTSGEIRTQNKAVTAGDTITISVPSVEKYGYKFDKWIPSPEELTWADGYGASSIRTSFVMPEHDLTIRATYKDIEVESIKLKKDEITLAPDKTYSLKVDIRPSNAIRKSLSYKSADESIVTVDEFGVVTAVGEGVTSIYITCGNASTFCTITVKSSDKRTTSGSEYLRINASSVKMYIGSTYKLVVSSKNSGKITYRSSDSSVATVSASGVISGVSEGACTVTATSSSGKTSDSVHVTVVAKYTQSGNGTDRTSGISTRNTKSQNPELMLLYKAQAAKYKADADKLRADRLRAQGKTEASDLSTITADRNTQKESGNYPVYRDTASQPTGDSTNTILWSIIGAVSTIAAITVIFYRKKKNDRKQSEKKVVSNGNDREKDSPENDNGKGERNHFFKNLFKGTMIAFILITMSSGGSQINALAQENCYYPKYEGTVCADSVIYYGPSNTTPIISTVKSGTKVDIISDIETPAGFYYLINDVNGTLGYINYSDVAWYSFADKNIEDASEINMPNNFFISGLIWEDSYEELLQYYNLIPSEIRSSLEKAGFIIIMTAEDITGPVYAPYGGLTEVNGLLEGACDYDLKKIYLQDETPRRIVHEVGHYVNIAGGFSKNPDFLKLAKNEAPKISIYAGRMLPNPNEYFAEIFDLYIRAPEVLSIISPASYQEISRDAEDFISRCRGN